MFESGTGMRSDIFGSIDFALWIPRFVYVKQDPGARLTRGLMLSLTTGRWWQLKDLFSFSPPSLGR